ncbi:sodium/calcium exchanger NCL2 isoform X1 [Populus trichocarpa]|uniref:sodium/calcium exchanger NCL2 isoform X1 n=1 Tax=Populus trichocarpa TaxID=3694 RepID=UPI002277CB6E|nr:sodium/calcium exchanger NCL2 isoform X1 [Populus trichocarpa]
MEMRLISKTVCFILFLLLTVRINVKGRSLAHSSVELLVSDGINDVQENQSSILLLKGMDSSSEEKCEQLYGFLPCSSNIFGHLFLIAVYEYMLFHGEGYLASGGEKIFRILGPGVFGASAFQVLGALPESLILLASGLLNTREVAQEYVSTGVGLLAGTSILLLTMLWGTCVIAGSVQSSKPTISNTSSSRLLSWFTEFGVTTDLETSYTARIMGLSVLPFLILQIPKIFNSNSGEYLTILISLVVSVASLLIYFFYQIFEPWIQKRRLEYVKYDEALLRILQLVQERALGSILTGEGAPNINAIQRLFEEIDEDGDDCISPSEVRKLLLDIKSTGMNIDKDNASEELIKVLDLNDDKKITKEEFVHTFTKWLEETKYAMEKRYFTINSLKRTYQVFHPFVESKRKEREMKRNLMSEIVSHLQSVALGNLIKEDGTPDSPTIRRLFEEIDRDADNCISKDELKELMKKIEIGKISWDVDEAAEKIMEALDTSGDQMIDEKEFAEGIVSWLINTSENVTPVSSRSQDDNNRRTWEEVDKLLKDEKTNAVDKSSWAWFKAIMSMVLGVAILSVLAEPLIHSVQNFSEDAGIPSFFVSFVLVPLATNARAATSAITTACRKKSITTSLTFSEIYGGVFMNNVLGCSVLLFLVYARGLTWEFSAEVLVVLITCAIMSLVVSFHSDFPLWTSFMAFLLYPFSLLLAYVFNDVLDYV